MTAGGDERKYRKTRELAYQTVGSLWLHHIHQQTVQSRNLDAKIKVLVIICLLVPNTCDRITGTEEEKLLLEHCKLKTCSFLFPVASKRLATGRRLTSGEKGEAVIGDMVSVVIHCC